MWLGRVPLRDNTYGDLNDWKMFFMKASEERYLATQNKIVNTEAEISLAFIKHRTFRNL